MLHQVLLLLGNLMLYYKVRKLKYDGESVLERLVVEYNISPFVTCPLVIVLKSDKHPTWD